MTMTDRVSLQLLVVEPTPGTDKPRRKKPRRNVPVKCPGRDAEESPRFFTGQERHWKNTSTETPIALASPRIERAPSDREPLRTSDTIASLMPADRATCRWLIPLSRIHRFMILACFMLNLCLYKYA